MVLGQHTDFKFVSLLSKVDFGKSGYNAENKLHVLIAKEVARNTDK